MNQSEDFSQQASEFRERYEAIRQQVAQVIVGHDEIVHGVLSALMIGGHCLLEGAPGLGKTLLVRTLARVLDLNFNRIQFTPDLMPADILGTNIIVDSPGGGREFQFQRGPIFTQICLADEINRATPKTQSALLETMQEGTVTVGGISYAMTQPFFVLATQNPIEQEGTYPLPEAQLDRFLFKLNVGYSNREEVTLILNRTTGAAGDDLRQVMDGEEIRRWQKFVRQVIIAPHVQDYVVRLTLATHSQSRYAPELTNKYLRWGCSPRGAQTMVLASKVRALVSGQFNVSFEDVRRVFLPALRHRIILNFEAQAEGVSTDDVLLHILDHVPQAVDDLPTT